jgi:hypothetical protein
MIGAVRSPTKPDEAAAYIEQVATQLRDLAQNSGHGFLAYLIDMARLEAASKAASGQRPSPPV